MTTPPLAFMPRAVDPKKRTTTSDPKSASRVLMVSTGRCNFANERVHYPSCMIAGAYKEDRNSELEITFTDVGGLDEANATKKVTQGSKIPFEPEDPHAGYLVKPKTMWSHRTCWPTLRGTSGVEDPQVGYLINNKK
ncbi:hypothetical protein EYR41_002779 [Orbilia oligospora]|uniref:Uncharacterized protein n=1 Tax=Orbilia oligospora TaxID=2813651 RepID=A0A8H2E3I6_ORBOL|nr:hypothetical protein EYR41_002779 [Orbilia oligospora]